MEAPLCPRRQGNPLSWTALSCGCTPRLYLLGRKVLSSTSSSGLFNPLRDCQRRFLCVLSDCVSLSLSPTLFLAMLEHQQDVKKLLKQLKIGLRAFKVFVHPNFTLLLICDNLLREGLLKKIVFQPPYSCDFETC